jgi:peptide chain release factor 1
LRRVALSVLGARIRAAEVAKRQQAEASTRRNLLGSGDRDNRLNQHVEFALHRLIQTVKGQVDAVVGHAALREVAALSEQE